MKCEVEKRKVKRGDCLDGGGEEREGGEGEL